MFSECVYIYNRVSTKTYSGGHAHHGFQTIGLDVAGGNAGNGKSWLNPANTEGGLCRKVHRISSCNKFYNIIPIYISDKTFLVNEEINSTSKSMDNCLKSVKTKKQNED